MMRAMVRWISGMRGRDAVRSSPHPEAQSSRERTSVFTGGPPGSSATLLGWEDGAVVVLVSPSSQ